MSAELTTEVCVTNWFPIAVRPAYAGWYEIRFWIRLDKRFAKPVRRYWNGKVWVVDALRPLRICTTEMDQWRGVVR